MTFEPTLETLHARAFRRHVPTGMSKGYPCVVTRTDPPPPWGALNVTGGLPGPKGPMKGFVTNWPGTRGLVLGVLTGRSELGDRSLEGCRADRGAGEPPFISHRITDGCVTLVRGNCGHLGILV